MLALAEIASSVCARRSNKPRDMINHITADKRAKSLDKSQSSIKCHRDELLQKCNRWNAVNPSS